jgi:hypothetical protein
LEIHNEILLEKLATPLIPYIYTGKIENIELDHNSHQVSKVNVLIGDKIIEIIPDFVITTTGMVSLSIY